ncbi:MAG: MlrC C-terminal domain-containing protein [Burkholderiales bacterium]
MTKRLAVARGPMARGLTVAAGRTAMLDVRDIRMIVTERVVPAHDPAFFALHGVDLARTRLLCVKAAGPGNPRSDVELGRQP